MSEVTTFVPEKTLFLKCQCCCHALSVSPILDEEDKKEFGEYAITINTWDMGGAIKPTIWNRLKLAYRLIVYGDIHGDHVILDDEQIIQLWSHLNKIIGYW